MRNSIKYSIATGVMTLGAIGALAVPAFASTPSTGSTPGNSTISKLTGSGAVSYADPFFGPVICNEVHHTNAKAGQNFDSVNCTSTTGLPLTNVTPGEVSSVGWISDFSNANYPIPQGTLNFTVSADGLSYTAIGTYPVG
ncbi:MAG TPA: hypothetical protein VGI05_11355 [Streptosporangiaceae bacterium]|jgi:hypothetical protein